MKKSKPFGLDFLAPRTNLEPVTSPTASDSQACANNSRATRQSHSRLGGSYIRFRYSLLCAFNGEKQLFRLFFFSLTTNFDCAQARSQPACRWALIVMSRAKFCWKNKKDHTLCGLFFLAPPVGLEPTTCGLTVRRSTD